MSQLGQAALGANSAEPQSRSNPDYGRCAPAKARPRRRRTLVSILWHEVEHFWMREQPLPKAQDALQRFDGNVVYHFVRNLAFVALEPVHEICALRVTS